MSRDPIRSGRDRWLVSYADLMTLLFAFFTTMYAASQVQSEASPVRIVSAASQSASAVEESEARAHLRGELERELRDAIARQGVEITVDSRGVVVSFPESATFATASAQLSPEATLVIDRLAHVLASRANALRIEGHTDDVPIKTGAYRSNWELSTARASSVVSFLVESTGIEPARLSAAGYGQYHPRSTNRTPEGRTRNRRVDIVVLDHEG